MSVCDRWHWPWPRWPHWQMIVHLLWGFDGSVGATQVTYRKRDEGNVRKWLSDSKIRILSKIEIEVLSTSRLFHSSKEGLKWKYKQETLKYGFHDARTLMLASCDVHSSCRKSAFTFDERFLERLRSGRQQVYVFHSSKRESTARHELYELLVIENAHKSISGWVSVQHPAGEHIMRSPNSLVGFGHHWFCGVFPLAPSGGLVHISLTGSRSCTRRQGPLQLLTRAAANQ